MGTVKPPRLLLASLWHVPVPTAPAVGAAASASATAVSSTAKPAA